MATEKIRVRGGADDVLRVLLANGVGLVPDFGIGPKPAPEPLVVGKTGKIELPVRSVTVTAHWEVRSIDVAAMRYEVGLSSRALGATVLTIEVKAARKGMSEIIASAPLNFALAFTAKLLVAVWGGRFAHSVEEALGRANA